jgi:inosose dehydratase
VPWDRCLDEIAEAGFTWTELGPYGYMPTDPGVLRTELDSRGLRLAATAVLSPLDDPDAWPALEETARKGGELAASLGASYLSLIDDIFTIKRPGANPKSRLDESSWKRLIDTTQRAGELARSMGLRLAFHPCADTHVQFEDQVERLLDDTDPGLVSLCLDTGHHAYRGGDPVDFMRKHHDRIPYLHVKNIDAGVASRVDDENLTMAEAVKLGVMCEPRDGSIYFKGFADVLRDIGYDGIAMVEQDQYRPALDGLLPQAKRARDYFREVGIA